MRIAAVLLLSLAAGCGGGGGGSSSPPPPPPPPITPTLSVTLSPASLTVNAPEDATDIDLVFDALVSGPIGASAFPVVEYDSLRLSQQGTIATISGGYRVTMRAPRGLAVGGPTSGQVNFRICVDGSCASTYPGSSQTFSYAINVQLNEWKTFQRNAAHTAYTPIVVDWPAVQQRWEWTGPSYLFGMATSPGFIHVTSNEAMNGIPNVKAHTLRASDGSLAWSYDFGGFQAIGAPASDGQRLLIRTHQESAIPGEPAYLWSLDRSGPTVHYRLPIEGFGGYERTHYATTTVGTRAFLATGLTEGHVTAVDMASGARAWQTDFGTPMVGSQTPAADASRTYAYDGRSLRVFNNTTGAEDFSIADPFAETMRMPVGYFGSVVLGGMNDAFALSGPADGGSFGLHGARQGRRLVAYGLDTRSVRWTSTREYRGPPVVANGVVYAADNNLGRLDALDQLTGAVLWSWQTPTANAPILGSVMATRNGVFLSTRDRIFAIDTGTHATAWTSNSAGMMAISADGTLYVMGAFYDGITGVLVSNRKLTAFRLR